MSPPAIQFKGSGWYVTDYARASSPSPEKGEGSMAENSETKSETKTESKTETKPAAEHKEKKKVAKEK
jgi:predicted nucleic acid-binding Zn ribbon protein